MREEGGSLLVLPGGGSSGPVAARQATSLSGRGYAFQNQSVVGIPANAMRSGAQVTNPATSGSDMWLTEGPTAVLPFTLGATYVNGGGAQTSIAVAASALPLINNTGGLPCIVPVGTKFTMGNGDVITVSSQGNPGDALLHITSQTPSAGAGWVNGTLPTPTTGIKLSPGQTWTLPSSPKPWTTFSVPGASTPVYTGPISWICVNAMAVLYNSSQPFGIPPSSSFTAFPYEAALGAGGFWTTAQIQAYIAANPASRLWAFSFLGDQFADVQDLENTGLTGQITAPGTPGAALGRVTVGGYPIFYSGPGGGGNFGTAAIANAFLNLSQRFAYWVAALDSTVTQLGFALITNVVSNGVTTTVTTQTNHGLANGNTVIISNVFGATQANGAWIVTVTSNTTFTITLPNVSAYTSTPTCGCVTPVPSLVLTGANSLSSAQVLAVQCAGENSYTNSIGLPLGATTVNQPGGYTNAGGAVNSINVATPVTTINHASYTLAGGPVINLVVQPLGVSLEPGRQLLMVNGDIVTVGALAQSGTTNIPINSQTPSAGAGWTNGSTVSEGLPWPVPQGVHFTMANGDVVVTRANAAFNAFALPITAQTPSVGVGWANGSLIVPVEFTYAYDLSLMQGIDVAWTETANPALWTPSAVSGFTYIGFHDSNANAPIVGLGSGFSLLGSNINIGTSATVIITEPLGIGFWLILSTLGVFLQGTPVVNAGTEIIAFHSLATAVGTIFGSGQVNKNMGFGKIGLVYDEVVIMNLVQITNPGTLLLNAQRDVASGGNPEALSGITVMLVFQYFTS